MFKWLSGTESRSKSFFWNLGIFLLASLLASKNSQGQLWKRLIGRRYEDKTVQQDKNLLAYKIVKGKKNSEPLVQVSYQGKVKEYTPEEVSAMILQKMKDIAEAVCPHNVCEL